MQIDRKDMYKYKYHNIIVRQGSGKSTRGNIRQTRNTRINVWTSSRRWFRRYQMLVGSNSECRTPSDQRVPDTDMMDNGPLSDQVWTQELLTQPHMSSHMHHKRIETNYRFHAYRFQGT